MTFGSGFHRATGRPDSPGTGLHGFSTWLLSGGLLALTLVLPHSPVLAGDPPESKPTQESGASRSGEPRTAAEAWRQVPTDDESLWEPSQFGGDGDVVLGEQAIQLGVGDPLTGVRCLAKVPRENFEIALEARRVSGFDFFCGLTFPVGEGNCSLILGGWAGGIAGLSSIDGEDASENATKRLMHFDNDRWYRVRVRVDETHVQAWVDDERIVNQPRKGHEFEIRAEMDQSLPLGVAAFQCESELRNFRWRKLKSGQ